MSQSRSPHVLPASAISLAAGTTRIGNPQKGASNASTVELVQQHGEIVGIEVRCSCGEVVRVQFDYVDAAAR